MSPCAPSTPQPIGQPMMSPSPRAPNRISGPRLLRTASFQPMMGSLFAFAFVSLGMEGRGEVMQTEYPRTDRNRRSKTGPVPPSSSSQSQSKGGKWARAYMKRRSLHKRQYNTLNRKPDNDPVFFPDILRSDRELFSVAKDFCKPIRQSPPGHCSCLTSYKLFVGEFAPCRHEPSNGAAEWHASSTSTVPRPVRCVAGASFPSFSFASSVWLWNGDVWTFFILNTPPNQELSYSF